MENQLTAPSWQVDVGGSIYEGSLNELGTWIGEGTLLPQDKVRRGNLRWIEAQKVPGLAPFFNAKAKGEPMPITVSESHSELTQQAVVSTPIVVPNESVSEIVDASHCSLHPETNSFYVCDTCCNGFCKTCPSSYGASVKICPLCGAMCKPIVEAKAAAKKVAAMTAAVEEGFGSADFIAAIAHPFKFKVSLVVGAIMFMFLTLGKGAASLGGIYMIVGGIFSGMCANALTFGVLSNTINNFVAGRLDSNFMPEFENFDYWEDVVHPFFLSIAAYLSSFGPFLVVLAIGFYLISSTVDGEAASYKNQLEKIPGTTVYAGRELVDQSGDVKSVLNRLNEKERERIASATQPVSNSGIEVSDQNVSASASDEDELVQMAHQAQKSQLESVLGKTPETRAAEDAAMAIAFLRLSPPLVVIGFIAFLWGLLYFPAASSVAGYTRSFTATINPLVGLDTMRRLGTAYLKVLAMGFCLLVVSVVTGSILGWLLQAFNLPGLGNIPANAIGGLLTFYLMAVFSCILGYALYKNAEKLGLSR